MSEGLVCTCGHYKDHHNAKGRCLWEWHGKTCDCRGFQEDEKYVTLLNIFRRDKIDLEMPDDLVIRLTAPEMPSSRESP